MEETRAVTEEFLRLYQIAILRALEACGAIDAAQWTADGRDGPWQA